jgi:hypothetical protein
VNDSTETLLEQLERNIISFITTGNERAYVMVSAIKTEITNRSVVEILKEKKGVPTVIRVDGHHYSLQHPNQKVRGGKS